MKSTKYKSFLTLIFIVVLNCNNERILAQTARISASASFVNGGTTTITVNTPGSNTTTTGLDASGNPFTTNASIGPITTTSTVTGVITTVSAEATLPAGFYYAGSVVVLPQYGTLTPSTDRVVESLSLSGGTITPVGPANSFTQAAASILLQSASGLPASLTPSQLDAAAALIKAGAGINGLE